VTVADSGGRRRAVSATSLGILASRILGYVRDGVIMAVFGAGPITDAYLVAFLIPNLFRRLAGEGALSASFIPIFARKDRSSREDAEAFAGSAVSYVFTIVSLFCLVAALTSSVFVSVFAPGLRQSPEIYHLSSRLLSALFPYLLLMSLYALFSGMLNTRDRFGIPAAASALENAAVIAAAFFLVPALGDKPEDLSDPAPLVGRVEKDQIESFAPLGEAADSPEDRPGPNPGLLLKARCGEILPDHPGSMPGCIHKPCLRRSAAEGLYREVPAPGEKVQDPQPGKVVGQDVKKRLFDPTRGGAHGFASGDLDAPPLCLSGDDPHD